MLQNVVFHGKFTDVPGKDDILKAAHGALKSVCFFCIHFEFTEVLNDLCHAMWLTFANDNLAFQFATGNHLDGAFFPLLSFFQ